MIVVVAGVAGSGKTTVGQLLAGWLGWMFADGDSFHPAANITKMRAGLPLTDADREPWLAAIGSRMDDIISSGQSAVLACSALKRRYRDELLSSREQAEMVFLIISRADDEARVATRTGHFFAEPLLASQYADLELPEPDERVHLMTVGPRSPGQVVADIVRLLGLAPAGGQAGRGAQ